MSAKLNLAVGLVIAAVLGGWAQQPPTGDNPFSSPQPGAMPSRGGPGGGNPMDDSFVPPELIIQNQQVLGLTDEQKTAIREAMRQSVSKFSDLQWDQSAASEAFTALVKEEKIDETKALAAFDKLVKVEGEMKRLHIASMIKIKNILTADQQAKIREIKRAAKRGGGMPPGFEMRSEGDSRPRREGNSGGTGPQRPGGEEMPKPGRSAPISEAPAPMPTF